MNRKIYQAEVFLFCIFAFFKPKLSLNWSMHGSQELWFLTIINCLLKPHLIPIWPHNLTIWHPCTAARWSMIITRITQNLLKFFSRNLSRAAIIKVSYTTAAGKVSEGHSLIRPWDDKFLAAKRLVRLWTTNFRFIKPNYSETLI